MKLIILVCLTAVLSAIAFVTGGSSGNPPVRVEGEIYCPDCNGLRLLSGMRSRLPFLSDDLTGKYTNLKEQVYEDEGEVYVFSSDGGFDLNALCPDENHVIAKAKICATDDLISDVTFDCRLLKDPDRIEERYNATSDEMKHTFVNGGANAAVHGMYFMDSGDGIVTRVIFSCLKIRVEED